MSGSRAGSAAVRPSPRQRLLSLALRMGTLERVTGPGQPPPGIITRLLHLVVLSVPWYYYERILIYACDVQAARGHCRCLLVFEREPDDHYSSAWRRYQTDG